MTRLSTGLLSISFFVICLITASTHATSFDCTKASTFAESQICSNPHLERLDEQLNSAYVAGLASSKNKTQYRADQRKWLKHRDACVTQACVNETMTTRLKVLDTTPAPGAVAQAATEATKTIQKQSQLAAIPAATVSQGQQSSAVSDQQPSATTSNNATDDSTDWRTVKIAVLIMSLLLVVCIWLHSRGSMTIYSCYTDALWTTLTPFMAAATYFIASAWLELPTQTAQIAAAAILGLMLLQVVIQTVRHNGFSIFFLLALYAKLLLFTVYFLCMVVLIFSGARTPVQKRRQRNLALGTSVLFALLTGWMTRTRNFSHIDDYIAGRS